ncbi:MAG: DUF5719 family protein [Actinomycetota bacterium]|nr:DUF5719 family protein [Actinomycetota bacterium]
MIRWSTIGLLFGILVAGVLYDRIDRAPEPEPEPLPAALAPSSPALVEPPLLSNVWFCPVGSGSADGYATHQLNLTNIGDQPAVANIDLMTDAGPGSGLRVEIGPLSSETIDLPTLDQAMWLGATVEIVNGQGVVGHTVTTAQGIAQGPCASATSSSWYFADGVTTRDSNEYLALLNPFAEDVVFSMSFETSGRTRAPEDLKAAVVPGRSVRVIDVGQYVSREANVATVIQTVRGQLAVERLQMANGALGPVGVSLQLGISTPLRSWTFPAGRVHAGGDQRIVIFNPGLDPAEVDIEFDLAPADRASYGLVPVEAVVQPGRFTVVDIEAVLTQAGLPLPYDFGVRVVSANDVPVVAERWQVAPSIDQSLIGAGGTDARIAGPSLPGWRGRQTDSDPDEVPEDEAPPVQATAAPLVQPSALTGLGASAGSPVVARSWVLAWLSLTSTPGEAVEGAGNAIVVTGPAGATVEVSLIVAGELLSGVRATIPDAGWVSMPIPALVGGAPLRIEADQPVVAEAILVGPDGRLSLVPAIPVIER